MYKEGYPVARLRERIKEVKNGNEPKLDHVIKREELDTLELKALERLRDSASKKISKYQDRIRLYKASLKTIKSVISEISKGLKIEPQKGLVNHFDRIRSPVHPRRHKTIVNI